MISKYTHIKISKYTYINKDQNYQNGSTVYWFTCNFIDNDNLSNIFGVCHCGSEVSILNDECEPISGAWYENQLSDLIDHVTQEMIDDY
jgi:hypothetical protein